MTDRPGYDDQRWYDYPDDMAHECLFSEVSGIEQNQVAINQANFLNACLYTNRRIPGIDWGTQEERPQDYAPISTTHENITSQVVETISALVGKNRPKPTPVVKDASFTVERMAQDIGHYIEAEFKRHNVYDKGHQIFDDSTWAATAGLKLDFEYDENGNEVDYFVERVHPDEIVVDERCARYGMPQELFQRKLVPKDMLIAAYPDFETEIRVAHEAGSGHYTDYNAVSAEFAVVLEGWRRGYMGEPGRHIICLENVTLVDEVYDRDVFPFVFFRWFDLPGQFYGRPLVEELASGQIRYNELDWKIRLCQDIVAVPRIFADVGSEISVEQLDDSVAKIIRVQGNRPEMVNWPAVQAELYNEREREKNGMFARGGISQMSAQAKLPDNVRLDSSKALREFNMIENQRFAKQARRYENMYIECAKHIMYLSAKLFKSKGKVAFQNRTLVDEIDWDHLLELLKSGNHFDLQIEASSSFNSLPASREDTINTWIFNGWISPERGMELQGPSPDLEGEVQLLGARVRDIKHTLEKLDRDVQPFPAPSGYQDLQTGMRMVHLTYLRRRNQKEVPPKVLHNYETWMAQAQGLVDEGTAQANAADKIREQQAMAEMGMDPAALQANLAPTNVGPEGNLQAGVATTQQGTPVSTLI